MERTRVRMLTASGGRAGQAPPLTARDCSEQSSRRAFTLVELLVVIVIIGILAALITVAASQALKVSRRTAIKAELDQISTGMEEYKNKNGSYPPNVMTYRDPDASGTQFQPDVARVLSEFKRHLKQAFPRHREPDSLLAKIVGVPSAPTPRLDGGMTASEQLVFFLSGASADPKYPISGEGGIAYPANLNANEPIESRTWVYPFSVERLGPRGTDNYFNGRFITYQNPVKNNELYRINFWEYLPSNSEEPFVYFDTSRDGPDEVDPLAFFDGVRHVHALKQIENPGSANERLLFANPGKFQILHCGIDGEWGDFDEISLAHVTSINELLLFPDGPFVGEVADTLTNFTTSTIEDAQP